MWLIDQGFNKALSAAKLGCEPSAKPKRIPAKPKNFPIERKIMRFS